MLRTPIMAVLIALAAMVALLPSEASANGCGVPYDGLTNTYTVRNEADLRIMGQDAPDPTCERSATVVLAADIALDPSVDMSPIGEMSGAPFTGTFDGRGHSITGFNITRTVGAGLALFGYTSGATIRNVTLSGTVIADGLSNAALLVGDAHDTTISNVHVSGMVRSADHAAGIAALLRGTSTVTDSSVAASITAGADPGVSGCAGICGPVGGPAGGVAAEASGGNPSITRVSVQGSVTSDLVSAGGVVGLLEGGSINTTGSSAAVAGAVAGGLAGQAQAVGDAGAITDSYSTGAVAGAPGTARSVGGIIGGACGSSPPSLVRTYFSGTLSPKGAANSGGIIGTSNVCAGSLRAAGAVQGNLWDSDTVGAAAVTTEFGTGKTSAQMKSIGTYSAQRWSITNGWEPAGSSTWGICSQVNDGYPFLQWTKASSPCREPAASGSTTPPFVSPSILLSRSRLVSGQSVRIGIRTHNEGGWEAASVVSCLRLPANLVAIRATGAVRSGSTLCFRLGTVASGATVTRVITARAVAARRVVRSIRATSKASGLDRVSATPAKMTIAPRAARARVTG